MVKRILISILSILVQAFVLAQSPEVGRLMLLAFDDTVQSPEQLLERYQASGFIFYVDDIKSTEVLRESIARLAASSSHPLIFSIDQEGGPFNAYQVEPATRFPGNMMLAASGDIRLAEAQGLAMGEELAYLGINMNFAPVADVNSNPDNPIIGIRSFGDNPQLVANFAKAFATGLSQAGVAPVAKHFPGHGNTSSDSHLELPRLSSSLAELDALDLIPFKALLDLPAIMTAHILFENLDSDRPATLSPLILTNLLRHELGYQGVIVSDYLDMQALTQHYSLGEAAVMAIEAGVDLLLVSYKPEQQEEIYRALEDALVSGRLSSERISASIERIESLATRFPSQGLIRAVPDYETHQELARTIAANGASLISNEGILPLRPETTLTVIYPQVKGFGLEPSLAQVLGKAGVNNTPLEVSHDPSDSEIAEILDQTKDATTLMLGIYYWQGVFSAQTSKLYEQLNAQGKPLILVSLGNPDILRYLSTAPGAYLAVYGFRESNLSALPAILLGEKEALGIPPVTLTLP